MTPGRRHAAQAASGEETSTLMALPAELVAIILSSLPFVEVARSAEVNRQMRSHTEFVMNNIQEINDVVSVDSIAYVVGRCRNLKSPPYICGSQKHNVYSLRTLLRRWPTQLHLDWNMTSPVVLTNFVNSIPPSSFRPIEHLSLKVAEDRPFELTKLNMPYMHLTSLSIDAPACNLEHIVTSLNCRTWDVKHLHVCGDIADLGALMMYTPSLYSSVRIVNTADVFDCVCSGTEHGLRHLMNSGIDVELRNVIKFCCHPPETCSIVDLFTYAVTTSLFIPRDGVWRVDRLQADMIHALLENAVTVECGVFQCEMHRIDDLKQRFPVKLRTTGVF